MVQLSITQTMKVIKKYYDKKQPLFIKGAPGIGKSDGVRKACEQIAKEHKRKVKEGFIHITYDGDDIKGINTNVSFDDYEKHFYILDTRVSQMEPTDLRGIPFPDGSTTKWLPPNWLPPNLKNIMGMLFLDEMNLAPPSIQAAAYQLILDRRIGDYILPDGFGIIAAGNRQIDNSAVFPMGKPLKNRFGHIQQAVPSVDEWTNWAILNNVRMDMVSFIKFKPGLLYKVGKDNKEDAFPTPRTWFKASVLTDDIEYTKKRKANATSEGTESEIDEEFILVASMVGEGATLEYQGFIKLKNSVDIEDILNNPEKVNEITDLGIKYSLVSSLAEIYKARRNNKKEKIFDKIMKVTLQLEEEFGAFLLRIMKTAISDAKFGADMLACKDWDKIFERYQKFLR